MDVRSPSRLWTVEPLCEGIGPARMNAASASATSRRDSEPEPGGVAAQFATVEVPVLAGGAEGNEPGGLYAGRVLGRDAPLIAEGNPRFGFWTGARCDVLRLMPSSWAEGGAPSASFAALRCRRRSRSRSMFSRLFCPSPSPAPTAGLPHQHSRARGRPYRRLQTRQGPARHLTLLPDWVWPSW